MQIPINRWITYTTAAVIIGAIWWASTLLLPRLHLPAPFAVIAALPGAFAGGLWKHLVVSLYRVAASILVGTAVALPIGLMARRNELTDKIVSPFISPLHPVPKIVLLPIFLLLFGLGDLSKIALISFIIFFQALVTARDGEHAISQQIIITMRSLNASTRGYLLAHSHSCRVAQGVYCLEDNHGNSNICALLC